jgi:hypothetical protein
MFTLEEMFINLRLLTGRLFVETDGAKKSELYSKITNLTREIEDAIRDRA